MKTIELNEQEINLLKEILEVERIDPNTSNFYNTVVNKIIDKLSETVEETTYPDDFISEEEENIIDPNYQK